MSNTPADTINSARCRCRGGSSGLPPFVLPNSQRSAQRSRRLQITAASANQDPRQKSHLPESCRAFQDAARRGPAGSGGGKRDLCTRPEGSPRALAAKLLPFARLAVDVARAELQVTEPQRSGTRGRSRGNSAVLSPTLSSRRGCRTWPPPLLYAVHPPVALQRAGRSPSSASERERRAGWEGAGERDDPRGYAARRTPVAAFLCCYCYPPTYTPG